MGVFCHKGLRLSWKVDECKPLPPVRYGVPREDVPELLLAPCNGAAVVEVNEVERRAGGQGLALVPNSAQSERFVWDRRCAEGLCIPCQLGVRGCLGCFLVTDTPRVELRSGRV